ncbi:hypothetical protein [Nonomuraea longicatena]|uniref:Uncharacterized protein n=1 Tax=Nonomuraea longicatena TaxID=83682 RepID=A0ABN1PED7_9ACTN
MGFPKKRPAESEPDAQPTRQKTTWSPYDESSRARGPIIFVVGGVAILGLLAGGLVVMWNMDSPSTAQSAPRRVSAPLPSAPPGEFGYAGSRKTDPQPLTVKELFGQKTITQGGRTYSLAATKKDKKCGDGVVGDKLVKALKAAKCSQMIRASYRDKSGKIMGTVGIANLSTSRNAAKVAAVGGKKREVYLKALPGKDSVTKKLGSGSGAAEVWTHGHYAVLVWFQKSDGSAPDKKSGKQLAQAADDVTKLTVFKALDARSVSGYPS